MSRRTTLFAAVSAPVLGLALAFAVFSGAIGCEEGRFPTCKNNEECVSRTDGGAPVCFSLRCVECRYDSDCSAGKVCQSGSNTCSSIDDRTPETERRDAGDLRWDSNPKDEKPQKPGTK